MLMRVLGVIYWGNFTGAWHPKLESQRKGRSLFKCWEERIKAQVQAGENADILQQAAERGGNSICPSPRSPLTPAGTGTAQLAELPAHVCLIFTLFLNGVYWISNKYHKHHFSPFICTTENLRISPTHPLLPAGCKINHSSHLPSVASPFKGLVSGLTLLNFLYGIWK